MVCFSHPRNPRNLRLPISAFCETLPDEDAHEFHTFFARLQVFDFGRIEDRFFGDYSVQLVIVYMSGLHVLHRPWV
jgi:hypothetical protein